MDEHSESVAPLAVLHVLRVPAGSWGDLNRVIVKSQCGAIDLVEANFQLPAYNSRWTDEMALSEFLFQHAKRLEREAMFGSAARVAKMQSVISMMERCAAGEVSFTLIVHDPSGLSSIGPPSSSDSDEPLEFQPFHGCWRYRRTSAQKEELSRVLKCEIAEYDDVPDEVLRKHYESEETKHSDVALETICKDLGNSKMNNVVVLTGAGISVSAGIPDFRSPKTGLYARLSEEEKKAVSRPEDLFTISFFREHPEFFSKRALDLMPGQYKPTPAHFFVTLLQEQRVLRRQFTQNIDGLETDAGVTDDKIVHAHGNFRRAYCIDCYTEYPLEFLRQAYEKHGVPRCTLSTCGAPIKPDVVFFGESLPEIFNELLVRDMEECDLLVVMGTSLQVQPFASIIDFVPKSCARVLVNLNPVAKCNAPPDLLRLLRHPLMGVSVGLRRVILGCCFGGLLYDMQENERDFLLQGTCDDGVRQIARLMGSDFADRLEQLIAAGAVKKE